MMLWIAGGQGMLGSSLQVLCQEKRVAYVATTHQEVDIENKDAVLEYAKQVQPSHIINCVAYTDVDGAEEHLKKALAVNAEGAYHLALAARAVCARLIHLSTDYVFDGQKMNSYLETDPCSPINGYGMSKWQGEQQVLKAYPEACVIRTSWLFGGKGKNLISSLLKWMQEKPHIQVVANQRGSPTFCRDLGEAILELLECKGVIHFANQGAVSRYQMALDIWELLKRKNAPLLCKHIEPVQSDQFPTPAKRPAYSVLDTGKYKHITGKEPRSWKEAMENYVNELA